QAIAGRFDRIGRVDHGSLPRRALAGHSLAGRGSRGRPDGPASALPEVPGPHRRPRHARRLDRGGRLSRGLGARPVDRPTPRGPPRGPRTPATPSTPPPPRAPAPGAPDPPPPPPPPPPRPRVACPPPPPL